MPRRVASWPQEVVEDLAVRAAAAALAGNAVHAVLHRPGHVVGGDPLGHGGHARHARRRPAGDFGHVDVGHLAVDDLLDDRGDGLDRIGRRGRAATAAAGRPAVVRAARVLGLAVAAGVRRAVVVPAAVRAAGRAVIDPGRELAGVGDVGLAEQAGPVRPDLVARALLVERDRLGVVLAQLVAVVVRRAVGVDEGRHLEQVLDAVVDVDGLRLVEDVLQERLEAGVVLAPIGVLRAGALVGLDGVAGVVEVLEDHAQVLARLGRRAGVAVELVDRRPGRGDGLTADVRGAGQGAQRRA